MLCHIVTNLYKELKGANKKAMPSTSDLRFTQDHEWISSTPDYANIGISRHATEELGEIVFVDLPKVGQKFAKGDEFGTVESVKTLSSLYMPVAGEITKVNDSLIQNPGLLNESPYEQGWLIQIKPTDANEISNLMTEAQYETFLETV